jgi:hypothetical protein
VRRLAESGLSAKEFADELGVNVHTLNGWKSKLAPASEVVRMPRKQSVAFVEVVAPTGRQHDCEDEAGDERFELVLRGDMKLRIPPRFDSGALRRLVTALEGR